MKTKFVKSLQFCFKKLNYCLKKYNYKNDRIYKQLPRSKTPSDKSTDSKYHSADSFCLRHALSSILNFFAFQHIYSGFKIGTRSHISWHFASCYIGCD